MSRLQRRIEIDAGGPEVAISNVGQGQNGTSTSTAAELSQFFEIGSADTSTVVQLKELDKLVDSVSFSSSNSEMLEHQVYSSGFSREFVL